ncbi:MAG TPA: hypothetical protein PKE04_11515, partial [Clostridia bacterium]|nr:hypothetical protein [Clostridia bacterium]
DRQPVPGEQAQVVLIDLEAASERVVAHTRGWEPQMGANINWGDTDEALYFNDVDPSDWSAFCVKLNPLTGTSERLGGTIYRISPDGRHVISACMKRMRRTQCGYGVMVPDEHVERNFGLRDDDGLYITDTATGKSRLLVSIGEVFRCARPAIDIRKYEKGECYGFHCKYNPQGDRIIFTMRWYATQDPQPWNMIGKHLDFWVVTMKPDGSDIHVAVGPEQWEKGGHHNNWQPDGRSLSMNLAIDGDRKMYFVRVHEDGTGLAKISRTLRGSGHPTIHVGGRYILTDAYAGEPVSFGDGTVPIRWIDLESQTEQCIARVNVVNPAMKRDNSMRVDPHPAWAYDNRHIAFNGFVGGARRVFVADLGPLLGMA